jgi:hypothetical protein
MEIRLASPRGESPRTDGQTRAMDLLDQYGPSLFVDAVEASRIDRAFRKRSNVSLDDDSFWNDVSTKLKEAALS